MAAVAAIKRELGGKRQAVFVVVMQCVVAWVAAFLAYRLCLAVGI